LTSTEAASHDIIIPHPRQDALAAYHVAIVKDEERNPEIVNLREDGGGELSFLSFWVERLRGLEMILIYIINSEYGLNFRNVNR